MAVIRPRVVVAALAVGLLALGARSAPAQVVSPAALDHLQCYRIHDSLQPTRYRADLANQFGLAKGCFVITPARLLCAETAKTIVSDPQPPGGGPSGTPAGHFLCYAARCPQSPNASFRVEDQFGLRPIQLGPEQLLCAPANKLICGDGDIDPGEACDPGSDQTNTCPDGSPCSSTCTCPAPDCCQCPDTCTVATGGECPADCQVVSGATCTDTGRCEECPCGDVCTDPAGNAGHCRPVPGADLCQCVQDPQECPCGTDCTTSTGTAGQCRPTAGTNQCTCVEIPPPPDCPCGTQCPLADGSLGHVPASSRNPPVSLYPDSSPARLPLRHRAARRRPAPPASAARRPAPTSAPASRSLHRPTAPAAPIARWPTAPRAVPANGGNQPVHLREDPSAARLPLRHRLHDVGRHRRPVPSDGRHQPVHLRPDPSTARLPLRHQLRAGRRYCWSVPPHGGNQPVHLREDPSAARLPLRHQLHDVGRRRRPVPPDGRHQPVHLRPDPSAPRLPLWYPMHHGDG